MLKDNVTLQIGIPIDGAIIKVDNFSGHAENMTFWVNIYLNLETAENGSYLERREYNFELDLAHDAKEIYTQAYSYLKSLEEYENAKEL